MKTKKCGICGKRFRLHDWQKPIEREACFTCLTTCKFLLKDGAKSLKVGLIDTYLRHMENEARNQY